MSLFHPLHISFYRSVTAHSLLPSSKALKVYYAREHYMHTRVSGKSAKTLHIHANKRGGFNDVFTWDLNGTYLKAAFRIMREFPFKENYIFEGVSTLTREIRRDGF